MTDLFTREQASKWIRENNIKDFGTLLQRFKEEMKLLAECGLDDELTEFLGYPKNAPGITEPQKNSRNGHSKKTLKSSVGPIDVKIPHDKNGDFDSSLIPKYSRVFPNDIEGTVFSLYGKGMSTREISDHLTQCYHFDISHETISTITEQILPRAREWQQRPLEKVYPVIYLDGIVFSVHGDGSIVKKTAYLAYAINILGKKEILGIWIGDAESSKFWMSVLSDMKSRGVQDILIACVDGLTGFETAIHAVFPETRVQLCVVHQIRNSMKYVAYKNRREMCADLKPVYSAPSKDLGKASLDEFTKKWGEKYPYVVKSWNEKWDNLSHFYDFTVELRPLIYTTNPIENINGKIRSVTKKRKIFPNNDAIIKCIYLVVMELEQKWKNPVQNWGMILTGLIVEFGERIEQYL